LLLGWAGAVGAAELRPEGPAKVVVEAAPEATSVAAEELPPDTSAGASAERIDRFVLEGPRFLKNVTRMPIAELRQLAPLRSEQAKKAANPHDPLKVDEFRTLSFEGLEIYGFMGDHGELWPVRITVTSAAWEIAEDLKVGSDAARVTDILGEPTTRGPEAWLYQGVIQNVNFFLRRDKIETIEFIYYLD
jgi:hypothetical protein